MSRARHKKASGGDVAMKSYTAGDPNVETEAKEKKRGGAVEGKKSAMRLDRPGRKTGGRVGADKSPLSSAARITNAEDHDATEGNAAGE